MHEWCMGTGCGLEGSKRQSGNFFKDVYLLLNFTACQLGLLKINGSLKKQIYFLKVFIYLFERECMSGGEG